MKETLYTIPVNEAFDTPDGCPLCTMVKSLEEARVKYTLGPSMMEADIRIQTNRDGFCKRHFEMLFAQENKLSLALILQTHLEEVNQRIAAAAGRIDDCMPEEKKRLFSKSKANLNGSAVLLAHAVSDIHDSCVICEHVEQTLARYIDTLFYMWKTDAGFRQKYSATNAFCLPHYARLTRSACKHLDDKTALDFLKTLNELETNYVSALKSDIDRFVLKFDYRNADLPWENAKDAPKRAIQMLSGAEIE